tara:strand:+ start:1661 stop:2278 length:618 start_codon:yes stop_codon:yes gene_type:complete
MTSLINKDCIIKKIPGTEIIVVDNLFVDYVVDILRLRMQFAAKFNEIYSNYASIDYFVNTDQLTKDISIEMADKFNLKDFKRAWSFVYNNVGKGVNFHADPSNINVNIWVTPDSAILNHNKNGLVICNKKPPNDWTREQWNGNKDNCIDNFLKKEEHFNTKIEYKCNRAILFDGALFHKTDDVETKDGVFNKRVSYTMLYGRTLE